MAWKKLEGIVAAACTPLADDGAVDIERIAPMVDRLVAAGVAGLYVCGSTGEGVSLTREERCEVARAYIRAAAGRTPVIVQVGHNSLAEARLLAADAADAGADAVSATCPSYFKISSARVLVDCMAHLAEAAGDLPFFYYHIPRMTAAAVDMPEFLEKSEGCIPNLVGVKFTEPAAHDYQTSLEYDGGRYDILWGSDEMLASAVAIGARGAVGSTYNIAPGLYRQILAAMLRGDLETARALQSHSVAMIRILARGAFLPAMKEVMGMIGMPCGGCRLPLGSLSAPQVSALRSDLEAIGFFDWGGAAAATPEPSAARSTR